MPQDYLNRIKALALSESEDSEPREWYRIQNKAKSTARVDLFDAISWWGVSAQDFVRDLNDLDVDNIDLHINSPGGNVYDGIAIYNALKDHKATVNVTVDGIAASIASVIAMVGETVTMNTYSELMIHDAWGLAIGNAADMQKMANDLNRISNNIASVYADQAGGGVDAWRDLMKEETWFSAEEAVEAGLADKVAEGKKKPEEGDDVENRFDLSIFNHAGRSNAPAPHFVNKSKSTRASVTANGQGDPLMTQKAKPKAQTEGTSEQTPAPDPEVEPTEEEKEVETPSTPNPDESTSEPAPETPAPENKAAAATAPETVVVDKAQWESVVNRLATLEKKDADNEKEKAEAERDRFLDQAQGQGKFRSIDRAGYEAFYDSNPSAARAHIDKLAKGTVPVEELGHEIEAQNAAQDDAYPAWMMRGVKAKAGEQQ